MSEQRNNSSSKSNTPRPSYPLYAYPTPYQPYYYPYYPPLYPNAWPPPPYYTVPPPPNTRQQQPRRPRHHRVRREEEDERGRRRNNGGVVKKEEDKGVELENAARKVVQNGEGMVLLLQSWIHKLEQEQDFLHLLDSCCAVEILMAAILINDQEEPDLIRFLTLVLWGGEGCITRVCELIRGLNSALGLVGGNVRERWMAERMVAIGKVVSFLRAVRREVEAIEGILPELSGNGVGEWRRAIGKVQGSMVVMQVLRRAVEQVAALRFEVEATFLELDAFYAGVREVVLGGLRGELRRRGEELARLKESVSNGCGVFEGVRERADKWLGELEGVRRECEQIMDEGGIGFGGNWKVGEGGIGCLLGVCAGIARIVAIQQKAFVWVNEIGHVLGCMMTAWNCIGGSLNGVDECFQALDKVVEWKWIGIDRIVTSVEKSLERNVRFEEPPKTPKEGRRVRHARMKSSPDALLHLNVEDEGKEVLPVVYELEEEEEEEEKVTSSAPSHVRSMSVDGIPF